MHRLYQTRRRLAPSLLFALLILVATATDRAGAHTGHGKPVHVHAGTCDAIGASLFQLYGAGADVSPDGTPIPAGAVVGLVPFKGVAGNATTIDAAMPDLVAARHAIAVDESDAASAQIVARGVIGGQLLGDDLPVALREENGSGQAGIALLRADAERTVVTILLGIDLAVPEA